MTIEEVEWKTKTPFASIRRIVQVRPEIFKVRPGLWALRSFQDELSIAPQDEQATPTAEALEQNHSYYQGLLVSIGNLRGLGTFVPNQDKNKRFVNIALDELRSLKQISPFSYAHLVKRSSTVDAIWFNSRQIPHSFFEVEHSTDIQNSLIKFCDLQDFYARMIVVADDVRRGEFEEKRQRSAIADIKNRVNFLGYNMLVKQYEYEVVESSQEFTA